jgi:hypothetical protein
VVRGFAGNARANQRLQIPAGPARDAAVDSAAPGRFLIILLFHLVVVERSLFATC